MPLPLHTQLMLDMQQLEDALLWSIDARHGGIEVDPRHDAILYSAMTLLAVDGCIRLCQQLQAQQQLVSS